MSQATTKNPQVKFETSLGNFVIELYPEKAPLTVKNFLQYVDDKFYENTIFHRVIENFMVQGGGLTVKMDQKKTLKPIKNEAANGLSNKRGSIAMARTSIVDSATAQFFINVVDNTPLDHQDDTSKGYGYCVFGQVVEGLDTIDKIKKVETTDSGPYENVPVEPVVIISATRL